jgi:hypothetical protein
LPGLVIGIILAIFHWPGKCPLLRHSLYIAVSVWKKKKKMRVRISPVTPSGPGAFRRLKLPMVCLTSSSVNSRSSAVSIGWFASIPVLVCWVVSSRMLSFGIRSAGFLLCL